MIVISTFWMNKRHLDIIRIDRKKTKWGSRIKQYFNTGDTVGHDNTTKASRRAEEQKRKQNYKKERLRTDWSRSSNTSARATHPNARTATKTSRGEDENRIKNQYLFNCFRWTNRNAFGRKVLNNNERMLWSVPCNIKI